MAKLAERRASPRFSLKIDCRFLLRGRIEGKGSLLDISTSGLALVVDCDAQVGDEIIIYPEGVGRLEGKVMRVFENGIGIAFQLTAAQQESIGARIASVIEGVPYLRLSESRSAFRITYNIETSARIEHTPETFNCTIVDISKTGCLLKSDARPDVGSRVIVGALRGVVRRHSPHGFALEFLRKSRAASADSSAAGAAGCSVAA